MGRRSRNSIRGSEIGRGRRRFCDGDQTLFVGHPHHDAADPRSADDNRRNRLPPAASIRELPASSPRRTTAPSQPTVVCCRVVSCYITRPTPTAPRFGISMKILVRYVLAEMIKVFSLVLTGLTLLIFHRTDGQGSSRQRARTGPAAADDALSAPASSAIRGPRHDALGDDQRLWPHGLVQ